MVHINFPKFVLLSLGSLLLAPTVIADYMADWCKGLNYIPDADLLVMICEYPGATESAPLVVLTNPGNCIGNNNGTMEDRDSSNLAQNE
ncbi:hypothetical protein FE257_007790 [Aspergillus nanangensis]|uniref:Secreted protein n=1 Tax=Aspergillus nanangensis TaxID=2582783 RepID=A0AAD4CYX7_ASPNN|nr:hypothetical protein FE257_007790 [Aspergillus nanangensis]